MKSRTRERMNLQRLLHAIISSSLTVSLGNDYRNEGAKVRKGLLSLLTILTLVLCLVSSAVAEGKLTAPFVFGSGEADLTARIAEILELVYTAEDGEIPENDRRNHAANLMLAEPGTVLCDTQAALIAALQGYTTEDYRTAMTPICRVVRCPLYLVIAKDAAAEKGIGNADDFLAYLAENEYDDSLLLARHVEASPVDRAAVFLADELPLLTDVFFSQQIPEMLGSGDAALAVFTEADLNTVQDLVILFTLGTERTASHPDVPALTEAGFSACPEPALYLMTKAGTDEAFLQEAAQTIAQADLSSACLSIGFVFDPLSGEALKEEIAGIFADYKAYMTAEGLYFYE